MVQLRGFIPTPNITVSGTVGTHTSLSYSLNGGSRQSTSGSTSFTFQITLSSGKNTITVFATNGTSPESSKSVAVNYQDTSTPFDLTASVTGAGTISSSPAGISCNPTCTASFAANTPVTLTATPSAGATFTGWSGACSGSSTTCTLTMDAAKSVSATFQANLFTLTVNKTGTGSGTVTSNPAGIDCGSICNAKFSANQVVTLTATPSAGNTFTGWTGACNSTAVCSVTMDSDKTVTATFQANIVYSLTVNKAGTGSGTVSSNPTGINSCPATCSASFAANQVVSLTPTASAGSAFDVWSGACTGNGVCNVTMNEAKSVTATFKLSVVQDFALQPIYPAANNIYFIAQKSDALYKVKIINRSNFTTPAQSFDNLTITGTANIIGSGTTKVQAVFRKDLSNGDELAFVLAVGSAAPVGSYTLTLTAPAGTLTRSTTATLQVTECSLGCN